MSDHDNFEDESSFLHLAIALVLVVAMPLLPMVMGWYTLLR